MPSPSPANAPQTIAFDLTTDVPLLLLPIRLETRFQNNQLLIRVYPDAVHVDSFEPRLTEVEIQWGKHFWELTQLAKTEDEQRNVWTQLVQVFGPQRAAWIANRVSTNQAKPIDDPKTAHMPRAQLLPDKWVAIGYQYDDAAQPAGRRELFRINGRTIPEQLPVIPPFDRAPSQEDLTRPPTAEWLKRPDGSWLYNFLKAEAVGMGLRFPNPPTPIDLLLVYGIKASPATDSAKKPLEDLLEAHHYTQGLAFVSQGTPTNNTISSSSGYNSEDVDSFEIERQQTVSDKPLTNRSVIAEALGIDPTYLDHVQGADVQEQLYAQDMNKVLWESTWGSFLKEMLALEEKHGDDIKKMRTHFEQYVRARGPLPALRIGTQPYGVLPVMALDNGDADSVTAGPVACLQALRNIWRKAMKNENLVPRLTRGADNSLTILQVLAMTPTGIDYVGRNCTRIVPTSSTTSDEGRNKTGRTPLPTELQTALDAILRDHTVTPHQRTVFTSPSGLFLLRSPADKGGGFGANSHDFLFNLLTASGDFGKFPQDARELLLRETLDLCSHRLDAWITSLATKRLHDLRNAPPKQPPTPPPIGLTIGGYGWVENLESDQKNKDTDNEDPNQGNKDPDSYIHAPSLAHATTAAILRSGYLSRRSGHTPADSNALAINLSSDRIRLALHLVDGVRAGQSLGTLLGYRFERALHENRKDGSIQKFRELFPGSTELLSTADPNTETKKKLSHLVLDGLALLEAYKADEKKEENDKKIQGELLTDCRDELERLKDALDAVADLALAESVHHVAQGNPVRAGATLEAITRGETPPPAIEFVRTPRTGINHTHRISVIFGAPPTSFPWGAATPRAQAEPVLNAWVAQLLGPEADKARCTVHYTDPTVNGEQTLDVTIKDLNSVPGNPQLAPLDLIYLLDGEQGGLSSEIEQRIVFHVQKQKPPVRITSLDFARPLEDTSLHLGEVLEILRSIRRLITEARALEPRDVQLPEQAAADGDLPLDAALTTRATAVRDAFLKAVDLLLTKLPEKPEIPIADPPAVRQALIGLASYGLMGSIPSNPTNYSDVAIKQLHAQARAVLGEAQTRQQRAQVVSTSITTTAQAVSVLKAIFGEDFRVLPSFVPGNGNDLNQTFAKSTAWQGGDPLRSITWFQRIARVREGAARLDSTMQYTEALNGPLLTFQIGQLPYDDKEQWVALKNPPSGNRLSLAWLTTVTDFTKPLTGLLLDEWVESIPNKEEVTGLTFHYDAPQPRAPQALLLAVAPEGINQWNSTVLEQTLRETLELAKLRAVDLSALGELGQYLPAMYLDPSKFPSKGSS